MKSDLIEIVTTQNVLFFSRIAFFIISIRKHSQRVRTYENDDEYEEFLWLKLWPFRSLGVIHEFFNETRFLIWDVRRDIVHIDIVRCSASAFDKRIIPRLI